MGSGTSIWKHDTFRVAKLDWNDPIEVQHTKHSVHQKDDSSCNFLSSSCMSSVSASDSACNFFRLAPWALRSFKAMLHNGTSTRHAVDYVTKHTSVSFQLLRRNHGLNEE